MRASDNVDAAFGVRTFPSVEDAKCCYLSQGFAVTGFRQKDGRLTEMPFAR